MVYNRMTMFNSVNSSYKKLLLSGLVATAGYAAAGPLGAALGAILGVGAVYAQATLSNSCQRKAVSCPRKTVSLQSGFLEQTEFLRRLPSEKRVEVEIDLEAASPGEFRSGQGSVLQNPNWPILAMKAAFQGNLSETCLYLLFLRDACQKELQGKFSEFQLFTQEGQIDQRAKKVLRQASSSLLSEEEYERFVQSLQDVPPEESRFFMAERNQKSYMLNSLEDVSRFPLLLSKERNSRILIPHPMFFYYMLKAKFGPSDAVIPFSVVGIFPKKEKVYADRRVACLPFPLLRSSCKIHGMNSSPLEIYYHDLYHSFICSMIPRQHRDRWIELGLLLNSKKHSTAANLILDSEFYLYRSSDNEQEKFWSTLYRCWNELRDVNGDWWSSKGRERADQFFGFFVEHFVSNKKQYEDIGITEDSLQSFILKLQTRQDRDFDRTRLLQTLLDAIRRESKSPLP